MEDTLICSVIIPVYNGAAYIVKCLQSIIDSVNEKYIEVIVIDDGSVDGTAQIIQEHFAHDSHIRLLRQDNCGQCAARNAGMKAAQGKYLLFVDSDDMMSSNLWTILIPILTTEKYDVVYFGHKRFTEDSQVLCHKSDEPIAPMYEVTSQDLEHLKACTLYYDADVQRRNKALLGINVSTTMGACWRRSIQAANEIGWDNDIRIHPDGIFNLKMLYYCKAAAYIAQPLYFYRIRETSNSHRLRDHAEQLFAQRNKVARTILSDLYGLTLGDMQNEYIQRYWASLVYQIGVIMERDIFNRKAGLSLSQKKQRFTDLKEFYGLLDKIPFQVLSEHEKKILVLYKKSFVYNCFYFFAVNLYHAVGGIVKGRK